MSLIDGVPGGDPFTADPVLRLLDGELNAAEAGIYVSEAEVALNLFNASPVLQELDAVPPNAFLTLDVKTQNSGLETVRFFRADPDQNPTASWYWLPNDLINGERPVPVMMGGSHLPDTLFGSNGQVRQGYGFSFSQLALFRSGASLPEGSFGGATELPPPEALDQHLFAMLALQGTIRKGNDHRYVWCIPTEVHETGRVLDARVLLPPPPGDDAAMV